MNSAEISCNEPLRGQSGTAFISQGIYITRNYLRSPCDRARKVATSLY